MGHKVVVKGTVESGVSEVVALCTAACSDEGAMHCCSILQWRFICSRALPMATVQGKIANSKKENVYLKAKTTTRPA